MTKKIVIDGDTCIGCGACVSVAPDYFEMDSDGKSKVAEESTKKGESDIEEAIQSCPVNAISLKEK